MSEKVKNQDLISLLSAPEILRQTHSTLPHIIITCITGRFSPSLATAGQFEEEAAGTLGKYQTVESGFGYARQCARITKTRSPMVRHFRRSGNLCRIIYERALRLAGTYCLGNIKTHRANLLNLVTS